MSPCGLISTAIRLFPPAIDLSCISTASPTGAWHFEYLQLFRVHKDHIALLKLQLAIALSGEFYRNNLR